MADRPPARGDIWWAELDPVVGHERAGRRPIVIVSSNDFLESGAGRAAIVPITTKFRDLPSWVPVNPQVRGAKPSWALPDQIRTVDVARLTRPAGRADAATISAIDYVLRLVLDL